MFNRVAIIGVGLLGGSLARDLRRHNLANTIIGVCRSESTAKFALENKIVDQVLPIEQAVAKADLVVFATPMQVMLPLLEQASATLAEDAILTDVGSVKTNLYAAIKSAHPQLLSRFVFAHPIAGGENSGVVAAHDDLFVGKHLIVTETDEVDAAHTQIVADMWRQVGAEIKTMSLQQHDAIFAKTSHLPHVVAFCLVNYLNQQPDREQLFELAAAGFYDFTRIASSDAVMWRDICITNKDEVLAALDGFAGQIEEIRKQVSGDNQQQILDYFGAAKSARDTGLSKRKTLKQ